MLKYLIELNKQRTKRTGILWWNLIDCWPQFSDSVMDYYGGRKLARFFIQVAQNPLLGSISEPGSWHRSVIFSNDSNQDAEGQFSLTEVLSGEPLQQGDFRVNARCIASALTYRVCTTGKRLLLLRWTCKDGREGYNYMEEYRYE